MSNKSSFSWIKFNKDRLRNQLAKILQMFFVLVFLTSAVGMNTAAAENQKAAPFADTTSWLYRRPVTITNPAGQVLTNYQIKVQLDATFDFSKARIDGGDIRFHGADGSSLPYWVEKWDPVNHSAILWTKVPSIPLTGTTIYLNYGNASALSAGNGDATFDFFDDFNNGTTLDTTKWSTVGAGATVANSVATINTASVGIISKPTFQYKAFRSKAKYEVYASYGDIGFNSQKITIGKNDAMFVTVGSNVQSITSDASTFTWGYTQAEGTDWRIWEILWKPGEASFYVDGALRRTHTTHVPSIPLSAQFNTYSGSPTLRTDWVLVREYVSPEPTMVIGAEEIPAVADIAINMTASPDPLTAGNLLTYSTTVTNHGPSDATGVTVTDTLPSGTNFDSFSSSPNCSVVSATVTCNVGVLANGANSTLDIVVTPTMEGALANTVNVSSAETDPDLSNNSAMISTTINLPVISWFNSSWKYRVPIRVSNSNPTLTNYQVKIVLDSSFDFAKAKADGADLRITDTNGDLLSFWIESWTAGNATVWVKVPSLITGQNLLYLYYGNPAATSISNGDTTFDFFDHFDKTAPPGVYGNWRRVVVDNNLNGAHNVMVEDIDGDGKPDIVADAYIDSTLVWYKQPADPLNGTWTKYVVDANLPNAHDFQIGDINGDGRKDIVGLSLSASSGDYNLGNGYLAWYEKPVDPLGTAPSGGTGWTEKAPLPYQQGDGSAAVYNNEIYVFGGHYLGVTDPRNETYKYDPLSNIWTKLADMPTKRWGQIAVEFNGLIHVFGGMFGNTATGVHEIYNPTNDTWQSGAQGNPLQIPSYNASGSTHPDVVYFPDGMDGYKYWMVYTPYPPAAEENPSIVRSNDGITWSDSGINNPVIPQGTAGSWNTGENADPDIMYVAAYHKWFMVWAGQDANGDERIALAYSSDGKTWTQYNGAPVNGNANPAILGGGDTGGQSWENDGSGISKLQCPTLFYENGVFTLYYVDEVAGNNRGRAGFATFTWDDSTNNVSSLTRYSNNPTIDLPASATHASGAGHIDLSRNPDDGLYYMFAVRQPLTTSGFDLTLLTSPDKINWTDHDTVLQKGSTNEWDSTEIYRTAPVVDSTGNIVHFNNNIRLYYSAYGPGSGIGIADLPASGTAVKFQGQGPADMPSELANQGLMGIRYGDRIHLFYKQYHFAYDPATDTYARLADVPTPRTWSTTAVVADKIYVIGGYSYGSPSGATDVNEVYDPVNDTWATRSPMPISKYGVTRENPVINGKIYVTHGLDGGFHIDNYVYDPSNDTWTKKSDGLHPRDGVQSAVVNNKLYVIAGRNDYVNGGTGTNFVEEYDPLGDTGAQDLWVKTIIKSSGNTGLLGSRSMGLGDVDGDGNLDIVVAVDAQTYSSTGRLFWYKNPGGTNASNPSLWKEYLIDDTQGCGADAQVGDIDKDGRPDIVYAGNAGSPAFTFVYFAPTDPTNIAGWSRMALGGTTYHDYLVDFNGDGNLDIIRAGALSSSVSWLKNPYPLDPRNPANWHEYVIEQNSSISIANRAMAADIDGDGRLDIGMDADPSFNTGIFKWYRTPVDPTNVSAYQIYTIDSNPTYTAYAHDSYLADINGDGRIDMAGVGPTAKTVMWWVNEPGGTSNYLDPAKWLNSGGNTDSSVVTVNTVDSYIRSQATFLYKALRTKAKFGSYASYGDIGFNSGKITVGKNDAAFVTVDGSTVRSITSDNNTFTWGYSQNEGTGWKTWDLLWNPSEIKFLVDGVLRQTHTTNIPSIPLNLQFNTYTGSPSIQADWALVREYTTPEPAASFGAEEALIAQATLTFGNLNQTYDGAAKSVTVTTDPAGLNVDITYNGSTDVPTNAGSYAVVAAINDPNYTGTASDTLVIAKASSTTTLSGSGTFTYDGNVHGAVVSVTGTDGLNLSPTPVYTGSCSAAPVNVSDTPCNASYIYAGDDNHYGSSMGPVMITITPATANVTLGNLNQVSDGTPKSATVTTDPTGLSISTLYNGSPTPPSEAGSYTVVATVTDTNYSGSANGTLILSKATAPITLGSLSQVYNGMQKSVTVNTDPTGLNVNITYNGSATAPTEAGSYAVIATIDEPNYTGSASDTQVINKAGSTTTLSGSGTFPYDGSAHAAIVSVTGAGGLNLSPAPVYSGSCSTAPVQVSDTPCSINYTFAGDDNHNGSSADPATISITPAAATVALINLNQTFDGSPKSAAATTTPTGLPVSFTYNGSSTPPSATGSYAVVATITDPNYSGSASGTLVIDKAIAVLQSPSGTLTSWDHSFHWTGVSGATDYLLQVYNTSSNSQILYKWYKASQVGCASGSNCAVSPSELASLPNGSYKWLILDYGAYGYGTWTAFTPFVQNISIAVLQSPSGTQTSWDHSFHWTGVSGATDYLLQVYNTASNTQILYKWYKASQVGCASGSNCAVSPTELASLSNGSYKWLILDYGAYGYGYWTPYTNFLIQ